MTALKDTSMNTNMHAAFMREIARIQTAVNAADLSDAARCAQIKQRFDFFSETLHHHHEGEDTYMFDAVKPAATAAEVAILDQLEAEHQTMLEALSSLDTAFASLGAASDTTAISNLLDALRDVLKQHCDHEEREGMAIVQKYLTHEQMKAFSAFTRESANSMLVLPWVCDGADSSVADSTWGMLPPPVRLVVKPMMTRKYEKFSESCAV